MDIYDKLFIFFNSILCFTVQSLYKYYRGKLTKTYMFINMKNIIFMQIYMNYTYYEFTIISLGYWILSWYVYYNYGISI